jgi:hypothetical protein
MPYNDDTIRIHLDKRFIIDAGYDREGNLAPQVYKILSKKVQTTDPGSGKLLFFIAEADEYDPAIDNIHEMVANYIPPLPDIPQGQPYCEIVGTGTVMVGRSRVLEAVFYDEDGNTETGVTPAWTVTPADGVSFSESGVQLTLNASKKAEAGNKITVTVTATGHVPAERVVKVVSLV